VSGIQRMKYLFPRHSTRSHVTCVDFTRGNFTPFHFRCLSSLLISHQRSLWFLIIVHYSSSFTLFMIFMIISDHSAIFHFGDHEVFRWH
jgi:hypothetical protein